MMSRGLAAAAMWLGAVNPLWAADTPWTESIFSVGYHVPPTIVYVEDGLGQRSGTDPAAPLEPFGGGTELKEIPGSHIFRQSVENEDDPEAPINDPSNPDNSTYWSIAVMDGGHSSYRIHIAGVRSAPAYVYLALTCSVSGGVRDISTGVQVLVAEGSEALLDVSVDPARGLLACRRDVTTSGLVGSMEIACSLGLVSQVGVCRSLRAKAAAAAAAERRGNEAAAAGALRAFLNELAAQGGKHVKEPALTILREEAEALLNPPPPMPKAKKKPKPEGAAKPVK